jgi:predicted membrane-bound dolichyl-phosphate-mannose-protein mannosyltransferase
MAFACLSNPEDVANANIDKMLYKEAKSSKQLNIRKLVLAGRVLSTAVFLYPELLIMVSNFPLYSWLDDDAHSSLLWLGPKNSGKTTLLKQMFVLHGGGFTNEVRARARQAIWENMIEFMETAIKTVEHLNVTMEKQENKVLL